MREIPYDLFQAYMFWNATKFNPKNAPWYFNK